MKPFRNQKGFTLIELLIVVAIIGVLAAVGIPMYNGYISSAKENASKENHNRVRDFIAASFTKCSAGSQYITLKTSQTGTANRPCTWNANNFSGQFPTHFQWEGFKNPHNSAENAVWRQSSTTPPLGRTYIYPQGNAIRITTRVKESGSDRTLSSSVTKE